MSAGGLRAAGEGPAASGTPTLWFSPRRAKQLSLAREGEASGDASSGVAREVEDEVSFLGRVAMAHCAC